MGLARRKQRLQQLQDQLKEKPGKFFPLQIDVTKEDELLSAFKWTTANVAPVHILINSAGVIRDTNLLDGTTDEFKAVLDTNVLALTVATREAVNIMKEHNIQGQIININSLAGHYIPNLRNFNLYPASKHAVTAYTEVLRNDLNQIGCKIKVTVSIQNFASRLEEVLY